MGTWSALLWHEGAFLVVLLALGAGPASLLSDRWDTMSRLAIAPLLGFCIGTSISTTAAQFTGLNAVWWLLIPFALASLGLAVQRSRGFAWRAWRTALPLRDIVAVVIIAVAVVGPTTNTLHRHHTLGPGMYYFTDGVSYGMQELGLRTQSMGAAADAWDAHKPAQRYANLTEYDWAFRADFSQQVDASPIKAHVAAMFDFKATESFGTFLLVLLLQGGLAAFACVRAATRSRTWTAVIAGVLFGGAFWLELYFDTYQGAIVGLGLILPLAVLGEEALTGDRRLDLVLAGIVLSGFLAVYPLFAPLVAMTLGLLLVYLAWRARSQRRQLIDVAKLLARKLVIIVVLATALEPIATLRNLGYAKKVLKNEVPFPRVGFKLTPDLLPGWLTQTREFWAMPPLGHADAKQWILGLVIPALIVAVVVFALVKVPRSRVLLVLAGVCSLLAYYSYASQDRCTYCGERNLLPLVPVLAALIALGLHALWTAEDQRLRWLAVAGAVLVVGAVGQRTIITTQRYHDAAWFLDPSNAAVLDHLPDDGKPVQIEGYSGNGQAQQEDGTVYLLADDMAHNRQSIAAADSENAALNYLTFGRVFNPPGPEFRADYGYVLTRFAGVQTQRRLIKRSGAIALEQRVNPIDVTPVAGLSTPYSYVDPSGLPELRPDDPLRLWVTGAPAGSTVAVTVTMRTATPATVPRGVRHRQTGSTLTACLPATMGPRIGEVSLQVTFNPLPGTVGPGRYPPAPPARGVQLIGTRAAAGACPR